MPVLEHTFAAIFNYFVAVPPYPAAQSKASTLVSSSLNGDKSLKTSNSTSQSSAPRVRRNNSIDTTNKRSRMEAIKRRPRVFSLSLPNPPPPARVDVAGPSAPTRGEGSQVQTPHVAGPQRDAHLNPRHPGSSSTAPIPAAHLSNTVPQSATGKTRASKRATESGHNWAGWPQDVDVVGTTSAENLTKLIATGHSTGTSSSSTRTFPTKIPVPGLGEKKKGVKRKRSNSSVASLSSSFSPLSKKLSGLMARTPKKAKTVGNGLNVEPGRHAHQMHHEMAQAHLQGKAKEVQNVNVDIHAALRHIGRRLVGSSIDPGDIYTDKPDDALLSIPSVLRTLTGEPAQQQPPFMKPSRVAIESTTYNLWVACHKALLLFPYTDDKEEGEAVKEERECYAMQLFMAEMGMSILERLPPDGVLHVPVDPRVSNNVVDIIHHALYLVEAFGEAGVELHRLVLDIPATTAGIHAGQILSLQHNLHVNYTFVADLIQAAACLPTRPYGLSLPTRLMKNVGDEKMRAVGSSGGIFTALSAAAAAASGTASQQALNLGLGYKSKSLGGGSSATGVAGAEQDIGDHPAFETIRTIVRLVTLRAPEVVVSARDVDSRKFLHALSTVHAVCPTQECLVQQRWHAYLTGSRGSSSSPLLYGVPTDAQRRRADDRARAIRIPEASSEAAETPWEVELRKEVEHCEARNPKIQRRYVDREWIIGSGLSKSVQDLAFNGASGNSAYSHPPESFFPSLGGASKRSILSVMESALEEECKAMGKLHELVGDYMEKRFKPMKVCGVGGDDGKARSRVPSRESTAEA